MNFKTTITLIVVLAICLVLVWRVGSGGKPVPPAAGGTPEATATPKPGKEGSRLISPEPKQITKLTLVRGEERITFEYVKRPDSDLYDWRLTAPVSCKATNVTDLADMLKDLVYEESFKPGQDGATSLEDAGLAKPAAAFEISYKDSQDNVREITLDVGKSSELSKTTYVKIRGDDKAYLAKAEMAEKLKKKLNDYRDTTLVEFSTDSVVRAEFTSPAESVVAVKAGKDAWTLEKPFKSRADWDKLRELVNKVRDLRAKKFVNDAPKDLKVYGLDVPELKVVLNIEEEVAKKEDKKAETDTDKPKDEEKDKKEKAEAKEVKRRQVGMAFGAFSNLAKDARYAKLDDQPWVVEINQSDFEKVKPDLAALQDKRVVVADAPTADRIELTIGQEKVLLEKDKALWRVVQPFEDAAAFTAVSDFLMNLKNLKATDYVAVEPAKPQEMGLDKPRMTIQLKVPGQVEAETLHICGKSPTGSSTFIRRGDAESVAVVSTEDAEPLLVTPLWFRSRDIFKYEQNEAVEIAIERRGGPNVKIKKVNELWRMAEPVDAPTDGSRVTQILTDTNDLKAKQFVAKGNLAAYGLDNPEVKLAITVQPKPKPVSRPATTQATTTVASGPASQAASAPATQPAPQAVEPPPPPKTYVLWASLDAKKEKAYARRPDDDYVFEISKSAFDNFLAELHMRTILDFDVAQAESLSITSPTAPVREFQKKDDKWVLANDPYVQIDKSKVSTALSKLQQLNAQRFVVYKGANMAQYGLDKPARIVKVKDNKATGELHVSDKQEGNLNYATVTGADRVFLIDPKDLAEVDMPLKDYQEKKK